jgi:signal transduction histidine kinase
MKRRRDRRRPRGGAPWSATRIAFVVIVVFLLAQVAWWLIFQQRYIGEASRIRLASWERDAITATALLRAVGNDDLAGLLSERYPHLRLEIPSGRFTVDENVRSTFLRQQQSYLRMFAFEGPFVALVILSLLIFIARSLRAERDLKRRQLNFLAAVTHEFKTPLSTLRLLVQTTRMKRVSPDRLETYLEHMEQEVDRLERTSEQVLASARLEQAASERAGHTPALEERDLNRVVAACLAAARPGLEACGAQLLFEPSPEPLPVSLDEAAFGVVINNLLDNAVKYSLDGDKYVQVLLERDRDLVRLHVDDRGVGIVDVQATDLFERFYRAGDELTRRAPGVGLGLHLVRSITEAMNGWVQAEPHPSGQGSRFTVVLPRRVRLASAANGSLLGEPP